MDIKRMMKEIICDVLEILLLQVGMNSQFFNSLQNCLIIDTIFQYQLFPLAGCCLLFSNPLSTNQANVLF